MHNCAYSKWALELAHVENDVHSFLQTRFSNTASLFTANGFNITIQLRFHMISAHGIGEKLECPLCPKKLMTPNNLSGHLKTVHARESVTNKCFLCFKEHPTKVKAIACEVAHRKEKVRAKCQSYHFTEQNDNAKSFFCAETKTVKTIYFYNKF